MIDKLRHWSRVAMAASIGAFKGLFAALIVAPVVALLFTIATNAQTGIAMGSISFISVQFVLMFEAADEKHRELKRGETK